MDDENIGLEFVARDRENNETNTKCENRRFSSSEWLFPLCWWCWLYPVSFRKHFSARDGCKFHEEEDGQEKNVRQITRIPISAASFFTAVHRNKTLPVLHNALPVKHTERKRENRIHCNKPTKLAELLCKVFPPFFISTECCCSC